MAAKLRVGVVFGGRSGEHEVSLMSAASILSAIDRNKYDVVPIGITPEGHWLLPQDAVQALQQGIDPEDGLPVAMVGSPTGSELVTLRDGSSREVAPAEAVGKLDVVFPVLHGTYGEDGTIQGLLELAGVPYVGAGVLGSSVGMDKGVMKTLFQAEGIPTARFAVYLRNRWEGDSDGVVRAIEEQLGYPVFVKPANLGSSVGISRAGDPDQLYSALALAAEYDRRIIVEEAIENAREIECSVLGNDDPIASVPGEVLPANDFYDYESKYINDKSVLVIPAELPDDDVSRVHDYALRAFKAVDCAGMARVDFLLRRADNKLFINELNTIPGFTRISMYPKLWEASGIPYPKLIDRLIELAIERFNDRRRSRTTYQ